MAGSDQLLSDADVGIGAPSSALLSDDDVGLSSGSTPGANGPLSNSSDDGTLSSAAKNVATGALKGASDIAGFAGNIRNFGKYLAARTNSAIFGGTPEEHMQAMDEGAAAIRDGNPLAQAISADNTPSGQDVFNKIRPYTGEYHPDSYFGKLAQTGVETATSMFGPGAGAATGIEGGAGAALANSAIKAAPGAAAAGALGQAATDATGDPLYGIAAGVAVPAAAGAVGNRAAELAGKYTAPFAEDLPIVGGKFAGARDAEIGKQLEASATDPQAVRDALNVDAQGPVSPGPVPSSQLTTGQLTGDAGVLQAERRARTTDSQGLFNLREGNQNAANLDLLNAQGGNGSAANVTGGVGDIFAKANADLDANVNAAVQRAQVEQERLGAQADPTEVGERMRSAIADAHQQSKADVSRLYDAIGNPNMVSAPISFAAGKIMSDFNQFGPDMTAAERSVYTKAANMPAVSPFADIRALDSAITDAMSVSQRNGEYAARARLVQLKQAVQDTVTDAVENQTAWERRAVRDNLMPYENTLEARYRGDWEPDYPANGAQNHGADRWFGTFDAGVPGGEPPVSSGAPGAEVPGQGGNLPSFGDSPIPPRGKNPGRPQDLVQFLKQNGGIRDQGGELAAMGANTKFPGLVNRSGQTFDRAREAAEQAGYFGADAANGDRKTEVNDLLDAIAQHPENPVYSAFGQDHLDDHAAYLGAKEDRDAWLAARADVVKEFGSQKLSARDNRLVNEATRFLRENPGTSAGDAIERASIAQIGHEDDAAAARAAQSSAKLNASEAPSPQASGADLVPNFSPEDAARWQAAKAAHAEMARTYREGPVSGVLATNGFKDNFKTPSSGVMARAFVKGDKGAQTVDAFLKASGGDPRAISALQDYALNPLRAAVEKDGSLSPSILAGWKRVYGPAISAIDKAAPGFASRFDSAAKASAEMVQARATREQALSDLEKSQAAKFLNLSDHAEVENAVGKLLSDKVQGVTRIKSLIAQTSRDPAISAGLRRAAVDWMLRRFNTTAEAGVSGQNLLASGGFQKFVADNQATLRALFPAEQVENFGRLARQLNMANRDVSATRIKGSPGTAKDSLGAMGKVAEAAKHQSPLLAAVVAASEAGQHFGLPGALAVGAGAGLAHVFGAMREAGLAKMDDMMRDALLNPERARFYLSQVPKTEKQGSIMADALRRSIILGGQPRNP